MPGEMTIPALLFVVFCLAFVTGTLMYRIHVATSRLRGGAGVGGRETRTGAPSIGSNRTTPTKTPAEVGRILRAWYLGKVCGVCGRSIPPVSKWSWRMKPGLLDHTSAEALSWDQLLRADVPAVLESGRPLCEDCLLAESFRQQYPGLVTDRPETHLRDRDVH